MRKLIFFILFVLVVIGLYRKLTDPLPGFIPGVYARSMPEESAEQWDILRIALINKKAGIYRIIQRTNYCLMEDEKLLEQEYKFCKSTGYYYPLTGTMRENETGILIRFDTRSECLFVGINRYDKI